MNPLDPQASPETRSVLIVDDEELLGRQIAYFLRSEGWEATVANSVESALHLLAQHAPFDACISDVYLDESSTLAGGPQIANACKQKEPQVPCLLLTGKPSMQAVLDGLRAGASDFMTKPVDLPLLMQKLDKAIHEVRMRRQVAELTQVNLLLSQILPNTIEAKDPLTRGHSERVVQYSVSLARRCGVPENDIPTLRLASQLHDIGKIGTPGEILSKPGKLTPEEREIIEEHPETGYRILKPFENRIPKVREWVLHHHERWDGRGYPHGMRAEEVELPGRILILAEVYDALAAERSYKKPWPSSKIADFFAEEAGKHFDPELARMVSDGVRRLGSGFFREQPRQDSGGDAGESGDSSEAQGELF
jgi:putative two-component system response regulator